MTFTLFYYFALSAEHQAGMHQDLLHLLLLQKMKCKRVDLDSRAEGGEPCHGSPQRTQCLSHALKNVVSCRDLLSLFRKTLLGQKSKAIFL